jgi:hypothetical protein
VQLQVAEAQPAHREREVGGGDLLHPEKFLIETYRLIKIVSVDACVGKTCSFYKPSFSSLRSISRPAYGIALSPVS